MAVAGLSSLGVLVGYGVETSNGVKPTKFNLLNRINSVGGISGTTNSIDASALEDYMERSVAGRQESGSTFPISVNMTDETIKEWNDLITAYKALTGGKRMWFTICHPQMEKAFFIVAQPPQVLPMPDFEQNSLMVVEMTLAIDEYKGLDTKVVPTEAA